MWLFLPDSSLSVVAHRDRPDRLLVRSRLQGDIERVLPRATVWEDDEADYRWRAEVTRTDFAAALAEVALTMTATNVKAAIPADHQGRNRAYHRIWGVMAGEFGAYGNPGTGAAK